MTNRSMTATLKYALSSERKLSVVARLIRGKQVSEVLTLLHYLPKKAAKILLKVVKSATANAKNNMNIPVHTLYVKEVLVSPGPKIKRVRPVARSRMYGYTKQRSYVKVILDTNTGQLAEVATHAAPAKVSVKNTGSKVKIVDSSVETKETPTTTKATKKPKDTAEKKTTKTKKPTSTSTKATTKKATKDK